MNQKPITTREFIKAQFSRNYLQENSNFVVQSRRSILLGTLILYYKNSNVLYIKNSENKPLRLSAVQHKDLVREYYYDKRRSTRT